LCRLRLFAATHAAFSAGEAINIDGGYHLRKFPR